MPILVIGSIVPYVLNVALVAACVALQLLEPVHAWRYAAAVAAIFGLFAVASVVLPRGGNSAIWQTVAQLLMASVPGAYVVFHMDSAGARAAFLLLIISPLAWGVLLLRARLFLLISASYAASYGAVVWRLQQEAAGRLDLTADVLIGLGFTAALVQMSYLGGYVFDLRQKLRARAEQLETSRRHLAHLAHCDELTGAANRHHLSQTLGEAMAHAARTGEPLSVCLLDVDHFKRINDSHGHAIGDAVLQRMAQTGMAAAPAPALFGRWGGEEFMWLLPTCDEAAALHLAQQLRARIESQDWPAVGCAGTVTASVGVAQWRPGQRLEDWVAASDAALYRAKAGGRNCVAGNTQAPARPAASAMAQAA